MKYLSHRYILMFSYYYLQECLLNYTPVVLATCLSSPTTDHSSMPCSHPSFVFLTLVLESPVGACSYGCSGTNSKMPRHLPREASAASHSSVSRGWTGAQARLTHVTIIIVHSSLFRFLGQYLVLIDHLPPIQRMTVIFDFFDGLNPVRWCSGAHGWVAPYGIPHCLKGACQTITLRKTSPSRIVRRSSVCRLFRGSFGTSQEWWASSLC